VVARKAELPVTRIGDCYDPKHVEQISGLARTLWAQLATAHFRLIQ
jgi:hypothetical protein